MADLLFVPEGVDWAEPRDPDRVAGNGRDRDDQREQPGHDEGAWRQRDADIEAVQPVAHGPPGNRPGNDISKDHRLRELAGEKRDNAPTAPGRERGNAD